LRCLRALRNVDIININQHFTDFLLDRWTA
jgi:hypothetical protein